MMGVQKQRMELSNSSGVLLADTDSENRFSVFMKFFEYQVDNKGNRCKGVMALGTTF